MTIQMPTRQTAAQPTTGLQPMPVSPQPARRVGYETQRLGEALRQIGGTFADLADKVHRSQIRTEVSTSQSNYSEARDLAILDISKDPDYAGQAAKFTSWHDEYTSGDVSGLQTNEAKSFQSRWFKAQRHSGFVDVTLSSAKLTAKSEHASLLRSVSIGVKTGDFTNAQIQAEAMIADGNLDKNFWENQLAGAIADNKEYMHKLALKSAYTGALATLEVANDAGEDGLEAATEWLSVPENVVGLTGPEKYRLQQQMRYEDEYAIRRTDREDAAQTKETIVGLAETRRKGESIKPEVVQTITGPLKKRWEKIQTKLPVEQDAVDWKATMSLQETVLEYLTGDNPKLTEEEILTKLNEGNLSEKEITALTEMMSLKFTPAQLKQLKEGFDVIASNYYTPGFVTKDEAKQTVSNRRALMQKVQDDLISRKKEVTLENVFKIASELNITTGRTMVSYPLVPGGASYKMPPKPSDPAELALFERVIPSWFGYSREKQEAIWLDVRSGMKWKDIIRKDYPE